MPVPDSRKLISPLPEQAAQPPAAMDMDPHLRYQTSATTLSKMHPAARRFNKQMRRFLSKHEFEIGSIHEPIHHLAPTTAMEVSEPKRIADSTWLCKRIIQLHNVPVRVLERWFTRMDESRHGNCETIWALYTAESRAYSMLTHLQGTVVPYHYTTVHPCTDKLTTRTPAMLLEQLDEKNGFVTLQQWMRENQERKEEVCVRSFKALQMIHCSGVSHGSIDGTKVLVQRNTRQVVFTGFEQSVVLDEQFDRDGEMESDVEELGRVWKGTTTIVYGSLESLEGSWF